MNPGPKPSAELRARFIRACQGNTTLAQAARDAGLSRQHAHRLVKELGIIRTLSIPAEVSAKYDRLIKEGF